MSDRYDPPAGSAGDDPSGSASTGGGLSPHHQEIVQTLLARRNGGGRRRHSFGARVARACAAFTVLFLVVSSGFVYLEYLHYNSQITREKGILNVKDPSIKDKSYQLHAANYLVIGSDSRAGTDGQYGHDVTGARSDTTMIVHLSPARTKATVISIPRDSWLKIPACKDSSGKIEAAHMGQFNSAFTEGGAKCTIATVQLLTGIAITHYVDIDFSGFKNLINALGTVTICSPQAVDDPKSGLVLKAGNNQLNGTQALAYVRARETLGDGSDLGRIKRQQRFLGAVLREARGGKLLANPTKITGFVDAATKAVTVDSGTTFSDLNTLVKVLSGLDPKKVTFYTAPISNPAYDPDNPSSTTGSRVLLDPVAGAILYDEIIRDKTVTVNPSASASPSPSPTSTKPILLTQAASSITVDVTNGVGTALLATKVQNALAGVGFGKGVLGLDAQGLTTTVVKYRASQLAAAETVASAIPGSTMQLDPSHSGNIEVVVGSSYSGVKAVSVGDPLPSSLSASVTATATTSTTASNAPTGISGADTTCSE